MNSNAPFCFGARPRWGHISPVGLHVVLPKEALKCEWNTETNRITRPSRPVHCEWMLKGFLWEKSLACMWQKQIKNVQCFWLKEIKLAANVVASEGSTEELFYRIANNLCCTENVVSILVLVSLGFCFERQWLSSRDMLSEIVARRVRNFSRTALSMCGSNLI